MFATASIVQVGEKRVYTGSARIRILNLCPGGLRFVSSLRLPADNRVILEICFKLDGPEYCLKGCIVHSSCTEVNEYEYGFHFLEPVEKLREALKKLFNRMYVMSNRRIVILRLQ